MVEKNRKFKKIVSIVSACAVFVFALALPFIFKPKINTKSMVASADEVVSDNYFDGSNLLVPFCLFQGDGPLTGGTYSYYNGFFGVSFGKNSGKFSLTQGTNNSYIFNNVNISSFGTASASHWSLNSGVVWHAIDFLVSGTSDYFRLYCIVGSDFNSDVKGVNISSYVCSSGTISEDFRGVSTRTVSITVVRYFGSDSEGNLDTTNFLEFMFVNNNIYNSASRYQSRTYYFTQVDKDSAMYLEGYNAGQSAGYSAGNSAGYKQGYSVGDTQGYNRGYTAGANSANNYTFTKLIGAVVDVPVQTFISLFNFELLGINLAGFFTGLLTVAFIITVVKLLI